MKKEKTVKTHTRKLKSGKQVTVKQHTASYDAADVVADVLKKKGAGGELEQLKKKKAIKPEPIEKEDIYSEYGFTKDEFAEWYEGTGSKADKKVEKILRKAMGRKAYNELSDSAADNYKKGGANGFFKKSLKAMKETTVPASSKKSEGEKPTYKSVNDLHRSLAADRFGEGEEISGKKRTEALGLLEKAGYRKVGSYMVPPRGKGPLYSDYRGTLYQADEDARRDLYTGHDILTKSQRETMKELGYYSKKTYRGGNYWEEDYASSGVPRKKTKEPTSDIPKGAVKGYPEVKATFKPTKATTQEQKWDHQFGKVGEDGAISMYEDYRKALYSGDKKEIKRTRYNLETTFNEGGVVTPTMQRIAKIAGLKIDPESIFLDANGNRKQARMPKSSPKSGGTKLTAAQNRLISSQDQTDKLPRSFGEFAGKRIESLMTDKGTFAAKFRREYPEFCKAYSAEYKRRRAEREAKQAAKPTKRYKKDYELGPDGETRIVHKEVTPTRPPKRNTEETEESSMPPKKVPISGPQAAIQRRRRIERLEEESQLRRSIELLVKSRDKYRRGTVGYGETQRKINALQGRLNEIRRH